MKKHARSIAIIFFILFVTVICFRLVFSPSSPSSPVSSGSAPPLPPFLEIGGKTYYPGSAVSLSEEDVGELIGIVHSRGLNGSEAKSNIRTNYLEEGAEIRELAGRNPDFTVCAQNKSGEWQRYERADALPAGTNLNDFFNMRGKVRSISVESWPVGVNDFIFDKADVERLTDLFLRGSSFTGEGSGSVDSHTFDYTVSFFADSGGFSGRISQDSRFIAAIGSKLELDREFAMQVLSCAESNRYRRIIPQSVGGGFFACENDSAWDYSGVNMTLGDFEITNDGALVASGLHKYVLMPVGVTDAQVWANTAWFLKDGDIYELSLNISIDEYKKIRDYAILGDYITGPRVIKAGDFSAFRVAIDCRYFENGAKPLHAFDEALITLDRNGVLSNANHRIDGVKFFEVDSQSILYATDDGLFEIPIGKGEPKQLHQGDVLAVAPLPYGAAYSTTESVAIIRYDNMKTYEIADFGAKQMISLKDGRIYLLRQSDGAVMRFDLKGNLTEVFSDKADRFGSDGRALYVDIGGERIICRE